MSPGASHGLRNVRAGLIGKDFLNATKFHERIYTMSAERSEEFLFVSLFDKHG